MSTNNKAVCSCFVSLSVHLSQSSVKLLRQLDDLSHNSSVSLWQEKVRTPVHTHGRRDWGNRRRALLTKLRSEHEVAVEEICL